MPLEQRTSLEDLPLEELSQPLPTTTNMQSPDAGHQERLQELISRPAAPTSFPTELPERPQQSSSRKWMIAAGVLSILLSGFIASTAVLGSHIAQTPPAEITAPLVVTVTKTPTPSATTVTLHETATATRTVVEICNHDVANQERFISSHYCVIVDCSNNTQVDIWQNNCKDFCRDQDFCSNNPYTMGSRMKDCCSQCNCSTTDGDE